MRKLFLLFWLFVFSQMLPGSGALPALPLTQQQPVPAIQTPQNEECQDVPSCIKIIKDLKAQLNKLRGSSAKTNKARGSLTRALRKSESTLTHLEGTSGSHSQEVAASGPGAKRPNPSLSTSPTPSLASFLTWINMEREKSIFERVERTGDIYLLKDAAIGIIEIKYDKTVKPNSSFRLTVTVTPRDIIEESTLIGLSKVPITCFVRPYYKSEKSTAEYSVQESGNNDPDRELRSGTPITWVWSVTTTRGFEIDRANFYVHAKFKMADQESDWREVSKSEIEFSERPFDGVYTFYLNHLSLFNGLLALVTALITLWGARIGLLTKRKTQAATELADEIDTLHLELKAQRELLDRTQAELEETQSSKTNLQVEINLLRRRLGRILQRVFGRDRWRKLSGVAQVRLKDGNLRLAEVYLFEAHGTGNKLIGTGRHSDQDIRLGIKFKASGSRSKSIEIILICKNQDL